MDQAIGVFTRSDELLDRLRQICPSFRFSLAELAGPASSVAIVDDDSFEVVDSLRSTVCVVLNGDRSRPRHPRELRIDRETFLDTAAEVLAFAGELAETSLRAERLEQEVGYLSEIHELMMMTDAEAVSGRITRTILTILALERGTLLIHDPRQERYVVSFTNDEGFRDSAEFLPGVPPAGLQEALSSPARFAVSRNDGGEWLVVVPLQVGDDLLGVIRIALPAGHEITAERAANASRYLAAVAQVLSNIYQLTRSRDLALRDDLTKAYNRRFFETYLDEEIERARRYGTIFTIIFLDLDDLRVVNERHGHLSGSRTLQEVAKRILGAVRGIDKVVRFGGDEFCIILPQTDQDQAVAVANRVRRALSADSLQIDPAVDVKVTASFGVATFPIHATTKEELIREADAAMYKVKTAGKNAVGVAVLGGGSRSVSGH